MSECDYWGEQNTELHNYYVKLQQTNVQAKSWLCDCDTTINEDQVALFNEDWQVRLSMLAIFENQTNFHICICKIFRYIGEI